MNNISNNSMAHETAEAQAQVLNTKPTMDNSKPASFLLGFQRKLDRIDAKKNQVFEVVDHSSEDCMV